MAYRSSMSSAPLYLLLNRISVISFFLLAHSAVAPWPLLSLNWPGRQSLYLLCLPLCLRLTQSPREPTSSLSHNFVQMPAWFERTLFTDHLNKIRATTHSHPTCTPRLLVLCILPDPSPAGHISHLFDCLSFSSGLNLRGQRLSHVNCCPFEPSPVPGSWVLNKLCFFLMSKWINHMNKAVRNRLCGKWGFSQAGRRPTASYLRFYVF